MRKEDRVDDLALLAVGGWGVAFAAPFLARMKFVDEQGEGTSPTLGALRVYREHRAAGRRGVPPDGPLDFAPAALQPLISRDGVTDRRR